MAETQAELEAQLAAIRAQKLLPKVSQFGARSMTARDMSELDAIEAQVLAKLAALTSTRPPRILYGYANGKGTC